MNLYSFIGSLAYFSIEERESNVENINSLTEFAKELVDLINDPIFNLEYLRIKTEVLFYQNDMNYKEFLQKLEKKATKENSEYYLDTVHSLKKLFSKQPNFYKSLEKSKNIKLKDLSDEEINKIHMEMIKMAGYDIENDGIDEKLIKIGLKDMNTERIFKNCSNLEFFYKTDALGNKVALETIGTKFIFCKHVDFGLVDDSFDLLYAEFKKTCCDRCQRKNPMPDNWKWSYDWRVKKMNNLSRKFESFMKNLGYVK